MISDVRPSWDRMVSTGASARGHLKKLLLVSYGIAVLLCQAGASPLAFLALNVTPNQNRIPADWQIKVNHGHPDVAVCSVAEGPCLRLKSVKSSFGLERDVDIDPATMPILHWSWKVTQLPAGGDFRHASTDDQAAQVLVAFSDRHVLSYIWDSTAPKGSAENASFIPLVHVFDYVCESGAASLNQWLVEDRDLASDYRRAYGKPAPHVKGLRIQINSQHTGSVAESYFGAVEFHSAQ